jgi:hypothetical protein
MEEKREKRKGDRKDRHSDWMRVEERGRRKKEERLVSMIVPKVVVGQERRSETWMGRRGSDEDRTLAPLVCLLRSCVKTREHVSFNTAV